MKITPNLHLFFPAFIGTATSVLLCPAMAAERPNIVIMIADDISASDLGCYGHPVIQTPNIDALAAEGMRFTNTILTTSSSSPSRCSIITGRYPHNTGACELHTPLGAEQVTIAGLLKDAGYYTAQAGKWHFGETIGGIRDDFHVSGKGTKKEDGDSGAAKWVKRLSERPRNKPFFMWLASFDAHRPWDDDSSMPRYQPQDVALPQFFIDDTPSREDFAAYYYEVSRFDRSVGKVVTELKTQGVYDNTVIIVMADNGRPFPRAKTRLIPEGIRTPLIIRYPPKMKHQGEVCNSLVSVIDIAPTIAQLAGLPNQPTFQGRSFLTLFSAPKKKFRNYAFAEHNWHDYEAFERMVCTPDYLLIENSRPLLSAQGAIDVLGGSSGQALLRAYLEGTLDDIKADIFQTPRPSLELYFYMKDTDQLDNRAMKNKHITTSLLKILHHWQQQTCDNIPTDLTPDWYSRQTLGQLPEYGTRGTMPGETLNAKSCLESGPF